MHATIGDGHTLLASRAIKAGMYVALDGAGRVVLARPLIVTAARLAELRLCAEVRDYVRHHWRVETGQLPRHSPMASSWNEDAYAVWDPAAPPRGTLAVLGIALATGLAIDAPDGA